MIVVLLAWLAWSAPQQAPAEARVIITVVDQTGAVLPDADVTIASLDDPKAAIAPVKATDKGVATVANLKPGRYSIHAVFPGFEPQTLKEIRLKPGDNKHVVVLTLQGFQDSVTVGRDKQEAASDRKTTFGTALTREQIDALSDDPDEMAQQLQDMVGGDAVIRVDSFEGGRLPLKSQIKSIHITRDAFAAENHFAGGLFIDIVTAPGQGPIRTNLNSRLRDGAFNGGPPPGFVQNKGPERTQAYTAGVSGSAIRNKASFSVTFQGATSYDTPYNHFTLPDGTLDTGLGSKRPRDNMFVWGNFDYALTRDQTLRTTYTQSHAVANNLGTGQYDLPERAYSTDNNDHTFRIQEVGPIGRRLFINTRASLSWSDGDSTSLTNAPTIQVVDAFTSGGQQLEGGTKSKTIDLLSDLDYVRGINSFRTGVELAGGSYHSNNSSNYLGTYTFLSLADYEAGTPLSYTIRRGDPNIAYWNLLGAVYAQDDIRLRKNLTLSPGVRYELQTHVSDFNNFGPRFGITYAPGKAGKMTLRASAGVFYDWLSTSTYEQTVRVNGVHQQEIDISEPSYPNPIGALSATAPTDRYLLDPNLQLQRYVRFSGGIDRSVTRMLRVNATYAHTTGSNMQRGLNLNNPVDLVRPDPTSANIVEVVDDARSTANTVNVGASMNFNPPPGGAGTPGPIRIGPEAAGAPRWNWRKVAVFANLGYGRSYNNTDGAFATPATGNIADDWGPASNDIRRRANVSVTSSQLKNFSANIGLNASSAPPYSLRSGVDTNGDLNYNDRPLGVGRDSERASGQFSVNGFFNYGWTFGRQTSLPPGIGISGVNGTFAVTQVQQNASGRYRLGLNVNVQNLTNHANYIGYTGLISSPQFGHPSSFLFTRKIDVSLSLSF